MNVVIAYYMLNIKMLKNEKITFLWSIVLPVIFLLLNLKNIDYIDDLRFFWAFIIISSYLYGVGIHAVKLRDFGLLKTYFSIKEARFEFFCASILTQVTYIFFCFLVFNLVASIAINVNFVQLFLQSSLLIILTFPLAFFSIVLTRLKRLNGNELGTIVSIFMLISMMLLFASSTHYFNPIGVIADVIFIKTLLDCMLYIIVSVVLIIIGVICIKKYDVISTDMR